MASQIGPAMHQWRFSTEPYSNKSGICGRAKLTFCPRLISTLTWHSPPFATFMGGSEVKTDCTVVIIRLDDGGLWVGLSEYMRGYLQKRGWPRRNIPNFIALSTIFDVFRAIESKGSILLALKKFVLEFVEIEAFIGPEGPWKQYNLMVYRIGTDKNCFEMVNNNCREEGVMTSCDPPSPNLFTVILTTRWHKQSYAITNEFDLEVLGIKFLQSLEDPRIAALRSACPSDGNFRRL